MLLVCFTTYLFHPFIADKVVYEWTDMRSEEILGLGNVELDVLQIRGRPVRVRFGESTLIRSLSSANSRPPNARLVEHSHTFVWSLTPNEAEKDIGCSHFKMGTATLFGGVGPYKSFVHRSSRCSYFRYTTKDGQIAGVDIWGPDAGVRFKLLR